MGSAEASCKCIAANFPLSRFLPSSTSQETPCMQIPISQSHWQGEESDPRHSRSTSLSSISCGLSSLYTLLLLPINPQHLEWAGLLHIPYQAAHTLGFSSLGWHIRLQKWKMGKAIVPGQQAERLERHLWTNLKAPE